MDAMDARQQSQRRRCDGADLDGGDRYVRQHRMHDVLKEACTGGGEK